MTDKTNQNLLPNQFTVRLADEELDYINENLDLIRGDEHKLSRSKTVIKAFTKAIQNADDLKPKEIKVDNPEHLAKIEELQNQLKQLSEEKEVLAGKVEFLNQEIAKKTDLPKGAIVLNLQPKHHKYFWGILEIAKKQDYAKTYEELLEKILQVFAARGEFVLTKEDVEYLNTLNYDGPGEN